MRGIVHRARRRARYRHDSRVRLHQVDKNTTRARVGCRRRCARESRTSRRAPSLLASALRPFGRPGRTPQVRPRDSKCPPDRPRLPARIPESRSRGAREQYERHVAGRLAARGSFTHSTRQYGIQGARRAARSCVLASERVADALRPSFSGNRCSIRFPPPTSLIAGGGDLLQPQRAAGDARERHRRGRSSGSSAKRPHAPRPRHGEANLFAARMLVPTGTCYFSSDSIVSSPPRHALD